MVDAALICGLLSNLTPLIKDEFSLFWSFKKEVQKLSSMLSSIIAVLEDAERKNATEKDKQTEDWLRKLKDVVYNVRDIMDECGYEDLRLQVKRLNASSSAPRIQVTNYIAHPFSNTWTRLKIGHKIKDVLEKLDQISFERNNLHLREITGEKAETLIFGGRETMSLLSVNVYGRDEDRKRIVDTLVNSSNDKRLSVLSIVGIGGLGKTTLAQMVINDEKVVKHFDSKIWVCISEEFDINQVMKDIIGDKSEASLEELKKRIRTQLNGKRYLIVLDDVWNEDENKWDTLKSVLDCGSDGAFVLATTRKRKVAEIMKSNQHFELSPLSEDACWSLFKERAFRHETSNTSNFIDIGLEIAKKCKGVPLVAKTLGAQLGFKSDVKEWCRIRDSEMWKISQNEEYDILSILKLSYYDLPYHLRRCFAFCAVFPKDTEIEKERLIQLWMANDLIPINKNKEGENHGNIIWDELCWRSFFQDEKEIWQYEKYFQTCKMHDFMHDLAQYVMKDECYTMDAKSSSEDFGLKIRHLRIMVNSTTVSLKKIGSLQSIILHPCYDETLISKEILSALKELPSLRVLEVSHDHYIQSQDLRYVRRLKHLRYLDLSYCVIKTLPNNICDLLNLHTLNLNNCGYLESLPRNTKDLINLQHLYLDGCRNLRYMPGGIGRLKYLKTLSLVVVGKKNRDCQLDEFKDLDMKGSLEIRNLERVSDASIARGLSMAKKSRINKLVLEWEDNGEYEDNDQMKTIHDKIGEAFEVSSTCLKILRMEGYKGVNIPKFVGNSSSTLTELHLSALDNVEHIFTLNNMNGTVVTLVPFLEELTILDMENLRELVSSPIPGVFPNLCKIHIECCPKLGALTPHLKSLKDVSVMGECSDELLNSISFLSGLTHLSLDCIDGRNVLFGGGGNYKASSTFQSLQSLDIYNCYSLRCLFAEGCHEKLARGGGCLMNLNSLTIFGCWKLMISLEQLRNLTHSLQYLFIKDCHKLVASKVEEADDVIALLHSLRERCGSENFDVDIFIDKEDE